MKEDMKLKTESVPTESVPFYGSDGFYLRKFDGYVKISCVNEGFYIKDYVAEPEEEGFIRKVNYSKVMLPENVLAAYGYDPMKDTLMVQRLGEETFVVGRKQITKEERPKPYPGSKLHGEHRIEDLQLNFDSATEIMISKLHNIRIPIHIRGEYKKVTLCMEKDREFIIIEAATSEDLRHYETVENLKRELGGNLQHFVGDELIYIQYMRNSDFLIRRLFRDRVGIKPGEKMQMVAADGRLYIAKASTICDISGETIQPMQQTGRSAVVCKDCGKEESLGEINEMMELLSSIESKLDQTAKQCKEYKEACQKQEKENSALKKENKKMQKRMEKVEGVLLAFRRLMEGDAIGHSQIDL